MDMALVSRIVTAYDVMRNMPGIFVKMLQNLERRFHCIEAGYLEFKHLL